MSMFRRYYYLGVAFLFSFGVFLYLTAQDAIPKDNSNKKIISSKVNILEVIQPQDDHSLLIYEVQGDENQKPALIKDGESTHTATAEIVTVPYSIVGYSSPVAANPEVSRDDVTWQQTTISL